MHLLHCDAPAALETCTQCACAATQLSCTVLLPPLSLFQVVDLFNRCVSERPEERPTAAELLTTLAPLL